jgi:hypothetical protein
MCSFDMFSLKSEEGRFSEKSVRLSSCESPRKLRAPPCFIIGYLEANCQRRTQLCHGGLIFTTYTAVGNDAMNKFGTCRQWRYVRSPILATEQ